MLPAHSPEAVSLTDLLVVSPAGKCSPFACTQKPNKHMGRKAAVLPVQQQAAPLPQQAAPTKHRPVYGQQPPALIQTAMPTSSGTSLFKRGRPAKHQRAESFDTRQNQLYMSARTGQSPHNFDLQQPLIV